MALTRHFLAERLLSMRGCSKDNSIQFVVSILTSGEDVAVSRFSLIRVMSPATCRTRGGGRCRTTGFKCPGKFDNSIDA